MTKQQKAEQAEAIANLRSWIKPGYTVYTILDHVSSSGMSRAIRVVLPSIEGVTVESVPPGGKPGDYIRRDSLKVDFLHPNYAVGRALGLRHWKRHGREQDALVMGGCGMDMGFALVYQLSETLYGKGYQCLGKGTCPSNYHVNHRDMIQCEGTMVYNPDGPNTGDRCRWVRGKGFLLFADNSVCPTCKGTGLLPNPDGPQRFDLLHVDGYALRHRWL